MRKKLGLIFTSFALLISPSLLFAQASSCVTLTHNFGPGASDDTTGGDVTLLQKFLAADPSLYPEGLVTGFFGAATTRAVQRYQARNGIASSGSPDTNGYGYIGPKTRSVMSSGCVPTTGTGGGFSISLLGTPLQTLTLGSSASWVLSQSGGSSPVRYVADWGDGQVTSLQTNPAFSHTYLTNGTFSPVFAASDAQGRTARLSAPAVTIGSATNTSSSCTMTAAQTSITKGNTTTLTWNAPNTSGGTISGLGSVNSSGSLTVAPAQTTTYTGQFVGAGGSIVTCAATVSVTTANTDVTTTGNNSNSSIVVPFMSVSPLTGSAPLQVTATIQSGVTCTPYTLTWGDGSNDNYSGDSSSSCTPHLTSGTKTHTYSAAGTYTVTFKQGTFDPQTATVTVGSAAGKPTCTLTASKTDINQGESITLTWSSANATYGSMPQFGSVSTSGTKTDTPAQTTYYSASFYGSGGNVTCNATVTVHVPSATGYLCGARDLKCNYSAFATAGRRSGVSYGDEIGSVAAFPGINVYSRTEDGITFAWSPDFGVNVPCEGKEITVKACNQNSSFGVQGTKMNTVLSKDIVCPDGYSGALISSYISDPGTPPSYSLTSPGPESPVSLISSGGTPPVTTYLVTCAKGWIPPKSITDCSRFEASTAYSRSLGCN